MLQLDRNCNHATRTTAEIHIATSQGMKGGTVKLTSSSFCLLLFQRPDPCVFAGPSAHFRCDFRIYFGNPSVPSFLRRHVQMADCRP